MVSEVDCNTLTDTECAKCRFKFSLYLLKTEPLSDRGLVCLAHICHFHKYSILLLNCKVVIKSKQFKCFYFLPSNFLDLQKIVIFKSLLAVFGVVFVAF